MPIFYSDKTVITRNDCGFIFTFMTCDVAEVPSGEVVAQIAMSPEYAKRFLVHLYTNIGKFEKEYGEIKIPQIEIEDLKMEKPPIGFIK